MVVTEAGAEYGKLGARPSNRTASTGCGNAVPASVPGIRTCRVSRARVR